MDCSIVRESLNEYVEGDLPDDVYQAVSEHLKKCIQCAIEESILRSLIKVLESLPQKSPSMDFTDKVMAGISNLGDETVEKAGLLSSIMSSSGLKSAWIGLKMMARSAKIVKYIPGPTVKLRTGEARTSSLTKLPMALGFRW